MYKLFLLVVSLLFLFACDPIEFSEGSVGSESQDPGDPKGDGDNGDKNKTLAQKFAKAWPHEKPEIIKEGLAKGDDSVLDLVDESNKNTALHFLVTGKADSSKIKLAVEKRPNLVKVSNKYGETPIQFLAEKKKNLTYDNLKPLIKHGALDDNPQFSWGLTDKNLLELIFGGVLDSDRPKDRDKTALLVLSKHSNQLTDDARKKIMEDKKVFNKQFLTSLKNKHTKSAKKAYEVFIEAMKLKAQENANKLVQDFNLNNVQNEDFLDENTKKILKTVRAVAQGSKEVSPDEVSDFYFDDLTPKFQDIKKTETERANRAKVQQETERRNEQLKAAQAMDWSKLKPEVLARNLAALKTFSDKDPRFKDYFWLAFEYYAVKTSNILPDFSQPDEIVLEKHYRIKVDKDMREKMLLTLADLQPNRRIIVKTLLFSEQPYSTALQQAVKETNNIEKIAQIVNKHKTKLTEPLANPIPFATSKAMVEAIVKNGPPDLIKLKNAPVGLMFSSYCPTEISNQDQATPLEVSLLKKAPKEVVSAIVENGGLLPEEVEKPVGLLTVAAIYSPLASFEYLYTKLKTSIKNDSKLLVDALAGGFFAGNFGNILFLLEKHPEVAQEKIQLEEGGPYYSALDAFYYNKQWKFRDAKPEQYFALVKKLVDLGNPLWGEESFISSIDGAIKYTPLYYAIRFSDTLLFNLILEKAQEANVLKEVIDEKNSDGTGILQAFSNKNFDDEAAEQFLQLGIVLGSDDDVVTNKSGEKVTLLGAFAKKGHKESVKNVLATAEKQGVDKATYVKAAPKNGGLTPMEALKRAADNSNLDSAKKDIIEQLLK